MGGQSGDDGVRPTATPFADPDADERAFRDGRRERDAAARTARRGARRARRDDAQRHAQRVGRAAAQAGRAAARTAAATAADPAVRDAVRHAVATATSAALAAHRGGQGVPVGPEAAVPPVVRRRRRARLFLIAAFLILMLVPGLALLGVGGVMEAFAIDDSPTEQTAEALQNGGQALLVVGLIGAVGGFVAVRRRRDRLRRGAAAGTAPLPGRRPFGRKAAARDAAERSRQAWTSAHQDFGVLRTEYAAFECDPLQVLRLPALTDTAVASTGRFVEAFAAAQALETEQYPPDEHATRFVAAVQAATRAWRAAQEAAERIRLSGLSPAERATVDRVVKLLTTAQGTDSAPERAAAYARARSELDKLDLAGAVHLPVGARAALDTAARTALTP